jgi:drug/metabolite transporter (DMT)-like permease
LDALVATDALALRRPPPVDSALLVVAVLAAATSGPLSAAIVAPALAISFWRCGLAAVATIPFAWASHRTHIRDLGSRERRLMLASGALLAAHFATWITGIRMTSVASATALVATQPVWAVIVARRAGVRTTRAIWLGMAIAFVGILLVTGVDLGGGTTALVGDGLALLGGIAAAIYTTVGERARQSVAATPYNAVVFAVAAFALLLACLVSGQPLGGYSARDWLLILGLTAGAQLLGHSLVNRVVRTTSATVVSLALLFEVPGAVLIAALWLGQSPTPLVLPAILLLFAGLVVVIWSGTRGVPTESPPG